MTNFLAVWQSIDQLARKFENFATPRPPAAHPCLHQVIRILHIDRGWCWDLMPESCVTKKGKDSNVTSRLIGECESGSQSGSNTLLCLIVGGHIALFEIFYPQNVLLLPLILAKCGHHQYQQNCSCPFDLIIQQSTHHQALHNPFRWNTVYHSIQFLLNTIWWDHQLLYFLQDCCNFPIRSFYYLPPLHSMKL